MIKWLLIFLLFIPLVSALDIGIGVTFQHNDTYYTTNINTELVNDLVVYEYEFTLDGITFCDSPFKGNFLTNKLCPITPSGGGGSSMYKHARVGYYDVLVEVIEDKYYSGDLVFAKITLKNIGDFPDNDTTLTYYLTDKDKFVSGITKEQIYEIPPVTFNYTDCIAYNGKYIGGECIVELIRSISLPSDSTLGEWLFNVEYNTTLQPLIIVYDNYEVIKKCYWLIYLIIGLIFILICYYYWRRKKMIDPKKKKKEYFEEEVEY